MTSLQQPGKRAYSKLFPGAFPKTFRFEAPNSKYDDMMVSNGDTKTTQGNDKPLSAVPHVRDSATPSTVVDGKTEAGNIDLLQYADKLCQSLVTPLPTSGAPAANLEMQKSPCMAAVEGPGGIVETFASQLDNSLNTQSSNVPMMRAALQNMMHAEHLTQGDTQTQSLLHPRLQAPSETTASPSRADELTPDAQCALSSTGLAKAALSPTKATELQKERHSLQQKALKAVRKGSKKAKKSEVILCQCGYGKEEGEMVNCAFCNTWQHLHCYGYTDINDPRLPDEHACYGCLLGDQEPHTMQQLTTLTLRRRGMHFALEEGLRSKREFVAEMGEFLRSRYP